VALPRQRTPEAASGACAQVMRLTNPSAACIAVWAALCAPSMTCSPMVVATRFTRSTGDRLRAAERFAPPFLAPPFFAPPFLAPPFRADDFFAPPRAEEPRALLFRAEDFFAPPRDDDFRPDFFAEERDDVFRPDDLRAPDFRADDPPLDLRADAPLLPRLADEPPDRLEPPLLERPLLLFLRDLVLDAME
jgi:hypothetical protein